MESLLPSEVARLVFGYLEDEECAEAAQNFLETSPHLKECLNTSKKGKRFSSKILGLNLVELLDLLSDLVSIVRDHDKYIDWENYDKSRLSVLLKTLNFVETGKHKSSSTIGSIGMVSRPEVNIVPSKDKITSHVQRRSNSNTSMVQNSGTFNNNTDSSSNEMLTSSLTLESYNTINIKQEHKIEGTKCPNGNPVNVTNGEEVWKNPHVRSTVVGRIGKSRVNKNSHKMRTQVPKIESLDMAQHQEHLVSSSSLKFRKIAPKLLRLKR
ncbi:uncharacterized protein LOC106669372 isoform X8 [Cimex lectularius]|uniref:LisH domain-containing protein n=1 Tax=Cimex lectularius TaxID=79782 RepID=A0A8I6S0S9_CIMLE|nr:uncharacterized protein LOC106669372 isoform X8 [Cimex lectularius]